MEVICKTHNTAMTPFSGGTGQFICYKCVEEHDKWWNEREREVANHRLYTQKELATIKKLKKRLKNGRELR